MRVYAAEKEDSYEFIGIADISELPLMILFLWLLGSQHEIINIEFFGVDNLT